MNNQIINIDFHSHILPGIDDGSENVKMSIDMLKMLKLQGIETVVASSHFVSNKVNIDNFIDLRNRSYNDIMEVYDDETMPKILLGAEVYLSKGLHNLDLSRLCIGNSNAIMIEFPRMKYDTWMIDELEYLAYQFNFLPIIAHIDRYREYFSVKEMLELLKFDDAVFQINCEFVNNFFHRNDIFEYFDFNNKIILGTDCHNITERRPNFKKAKKVLNHKKYTQIYNAIVRTSNAIISKA